MTLTPESVHSKQFTTVRMRTGYDMDEVDSFLDEVEMEFARLIAENEDLRARLTRAQSAALDAERRATAAGTGRDEPSWIEFPGGGAQRSSNGNGHHPHEAEVRVVPAATVEFDDGDAVTVIPRKTTAPVDLSPVSTPAPSSFPVAPAAPSAAPAPTPAAAPVASSEPVNAQAFRLLEMAQRTADDTIAEAQAEASRLIAEAESQAATTAVQRRTELADLERRLTDLRAFEREYRGRLHQYIAGQLAQLEKEPDLVTQVSTSLGQPALAGAGARSSNGNGNGHGYTNGNGNGNGHGYANGNGNGHAGNGHGHAVIDLTETSLWDE